MNEYKHTQVGYFTILVVIFIALTLFWVYSIVPPEEKLTHINIFIILVVIFSLSFVTLQTKVDDEYIRIKFGYGLFTQKFILDDVASAKIVRNKWYYGWGVKLWFWPRMMIYSVSGLDAVELRMKNEKIFRIGTDVPQELELEINRRLKT